MLDSRHEVTGADRQWVAQYEEGDLVRYTRGSKVLGNDPGEYARVDRVDARENRITIERENGAQHTYDPQRLSGSRCTKKFSPNSHRETAFSSRPRQGNYKLLTRELGTIDRVSHSGNPEIRMNSGLIPDDDPMEIATEMSRLLLEMRDSSVNTKIKKQRLHLLAESFLRTPGRRNSIPQTAFSLPIARRAA